MTDTKDDIPMSSSKTDGQSSKKSRPTFTSQTSNVSFSSGAGHSGGRSSGGASPLNLGRISNPLSLPRMSLRSLLMNSPFSKRNKLKRGCLSSKSAKSVNAEGSNWQFLSVGSTSEGNSSQRCNTSSQNINLISGDSKAKIPTSTESLKWGASADIENLLEAHRSSDGSISASLKQPSTSKAASDTGSTSSLSKLKECPLCLQLLDPTKFPELITCNHSTCLSCLKQYLIVEISESRVNITCPHCHHLLHPSDIHQILSNSILSYKYEDFMIRRVLAKDPDTRWCPAPDCGYAVIATGCASCPKLKCERPGCESFFCYHCKAEWHPNQTCDTARARRFPNVPFSSVSHLQDIQNSDDVKSCPRCQVLIVKMDDGSCNHITCSLCSAEFCWLCMKQISDLHYLSPSGCTFWGKKPWSRKKVIMWQLGTLVGAPVGIALLAGIAVPALIIGIPIWVGRKLHSHCSSLGKHKRNAAVVCGVTASALLAPVTAGVAVSVGIPILLAYVYGVVPISLCRSGGCGVTTSGAGVRIAFDDENDVVIGIPGRHSEPSASLGANPSIGEVSCGASLSAESAGHLLGESDRESASNAAIAPASLTGSIASSCLSRSHRQVLEMRVDVMTGNRSLASVDTHSSAASAHHSDAENASTRALAGSLLHYKVAESECESESVVSGGGGGRSFAGGDSVSRVMEASVARGGGSVYSGGGGPDALSTDGCGVSQHTGDGLSSADGLSLHSGIDVTRFDSVSAIIKAAKSAHFAPTDTDDDLDPETADHQHRPASASTHPLQPRSASRGGGDHVVAFSDTLDLSSSSRSEDPLVSSDAPEMSSTSREGDDTLVSSDTDDHPRSSSKGGSVVLEIEDDFLEASRASIRTTESSLTQDEQRSARGLLSVRPKDSHCAVGASFGVCGSSDVPASETLLIDSPSIKDALRRSESHSKVDDC